MKTRKRNKHADYLPIDERVDRVFEQGKRAGWTVYLSAPRETIRAALDGSAWAAFRIVEAMDVAGHLASRREAANLSPLELGPVN